VAPSVKGKHGVRSITSAPQITKSKAYLTIPAKRCGRGAYFCPSQGLKTDACCMKNLNFTKNC